MSPVEWVVLILAAVYAYNHLAQKSAVTPLDGTTAIGIQRSNLLYGNRAPAGTVFRSVSQGWTPMPVNPSVPTNTGVGNPVDRGDPGTTQVVPGTNALD
jgi:hypothetical protein